MRDAASRRLPALFVVLTLSSPPAQARAASIAVAFRSGDLAADGVPVATLEAPAASGGRVAFMGGTDAILTGNVAGLALLVRSGDPLPAPLRGSFSTLRSPAINDSGTVAFAATAVSGDTSGGLFRAQAGGIVAVDLDGTPRAIDLNNREEIAYLRGGRALLLWTPDAGSLRFDTSNVPGGGRFVRLRRIALDDSGTITFTAPVELRRQVGRRVRRVRRNGVFAASRTGGVTIRERGDGAGSITRRCRVAGARRRHARRLPRGCCDHQGRSVHRDPRGQI